MQGTSCFLHLWQYLILPRRLESCVMPRILSDVLIERLEAFQVELIKRVLKWPKHYFDIAAIAVLDVPTMKCNGF